MEPLSEARRAELWNAAQPPSEAELAQMNSLFPSYLFRQKKTGEIWTSCCGRHEALPMDAPVATARHRREVTPQEAWWMSTQGEEAYRRRWPAKLGDQIPCPFCGKVGSVKDLGRTGNRGNLHSYRRCLVLRWDGEALWGLAYDIHKSYTEMSDLTARPGCFLYAAYRFSPGCAEFVTKRMRSGQLEHLKAGETMAKPYPCLMSGAASYDVIGIGAVAQSPFRYCGLSEYHGDTAQFLTLCCFYPRQVEMLMKAGLPGVVYARAERGVLSKRLFDWENPCPRESFGVEKSVLRAFLALEDKDEMILDAYKRLHKRKISVTIAAMAEERQLTGGHFWRCINWQVKTKLSWERLKHYLGKQIRRTGHIMATMAGMWADTLDAAKALGLDLQNEIYTMPRDLIERHDEWTRVRTLIEKPERNRVGKQRLHKLAKRYTYTDGRWLIRPAVSAAEVKAEGQALKHCVGGYADRYVMGKCVILFLRDRRRPGVPLCTIEMNGSRLVQIHGFRNEGAPCKENPGRIPPEELYKEFLGGWLCWVENGSTRDRDGRPVLPVEESARLTVSA